ncbi:hypothetical protein BCR44DRAFT_1059059 [Catenaria anguillulae PL171]|uniref:Uncharacterized protein n=1 Tax=Catenaria anguillulae PL171 TaxID=765915 RepID=A0A1Y2HSR1_9FUNG|nr:hypothetical protein BCR44DRAFT_1059059 [Catenaria anguillulae PL171]
MSGGQWIEDSRMADPRVGPPWRLPALCVRARNVNAVQKGREGGGPLQARSWWRASMDECPVHLGGWVAAWGIIGGTYIGKAGTVRKVIVRAIA